MLRCLYVDLDGTLLGRDGALLRDADGAFSMLGARALEACARADVEVVIYSGRRQLTCFYDARVMGITSYIFEAGAGVVLDGELHWLTGDFVPRDGETIFDQIEATGAPRLLLDHYAGRLEYHAPWHEGREVSHLFRGDVDAFEADELLEREGHGDLRLVDNGGIHPDPAGDGGRARLPPDPAQRLQGRAPSPGTCAPAATRARSASRSATRARTSAPPRWSRTFWLVANGVERDPSIREALTANTRVCAEPNGAGVYEAVITELAERR